MEVIRNRQQKHTTKLSSQFYKIKTQNLNNLKNSKIKSTTEKLLFEYY